MPAKKTAAKKIAAPPKKVVEWDDWDRVFAETQPCTVAEFAIAAGRPISHARAWITGKAAAGHLTRDGDLRWHLKTVAPVDD